MAETLEKGRGTVEALLAPEMALVCEAAGAAKVGGSLMVGAVYWLVYLGRRADMIGRCRPLP